MGDKAVAIVRIDGSTADDDPGDGSAGSDEVTGTMADEATIAR